MMATAPIDLDKVVANIDRIAVTRKLDQGTIASMLGIGRGHWNRIVNGKASIGFTPIGKIAELATALEVPLSDLLA